jgi:DNA-binding response OmpR family regulator
MTRLERARAAIRQGSGRREEPKRLAAWQPRRRLLLVEDDREMRLMLAAALRRDGYTVFEAANGDDALEWLGPGVLEGEPDRLPDVVVSDIRLPYFSGIDIAEGLQLSRKQVPVILITGFGDPETHAEALRIGAHCVLDKPFELDDLRVAIRLALLSRAKLPPGGSPDAHAV